MNDNHFEEQFVADLVEAQPQPVFWMRPVRDDAGKITDFEYRYGNEEMFRYTGLTKDQLIGRTIFNSPAVSDDLHERFFRQILEVYETGKRMQETIFNPKLNRYYSFLRSRVNEGVLTVLQDRDQEYKMIHELEKQKALLDNILRFTSTGISVTEVIRNEAGEVVDGRTMLANDAAIQFVGLPKEDYLGKTATEVDPGILQSPLYQNILETLRTGVPFHTQYYIEPTDRWLELSVSKMDEEHLVNVFTDVTNTKKAELEIQHQSVQLNTIVNTAKAGLFTLEPVRDAEGQIVDFCFRIVNQSVASYIGETVENLTGALASVYFPAYKENGLFDIYKDCFENDRVHHFDFHYEDGYDVFFNIHTVKTGPEILVTFTDQTALKRMQRELEATISELQRSNANLEEFAYVASHDLKEPIRKIHFFLDRLKDELGERLSDTEKRLFERMQVASQRMGLLIDDLLMYSQVTMRPKVMEEVDLNRIVRAVLVDLELELEQKKADLTMEPLPVVMGHARQLQQLFQNLVSNALKYTREGVLPRIRIRCRRTLGKDTGQMLSPEEQGREFYIIEVEDNGIGFEQKDAERIFNVFQRLHGNTEYKGTGVGLAIARKVAENHEGYLTATGKPGEGAKFRLLLPA